MRAICKTSAALVISLLVSDTSALRLKSLNEGINYKEITDSTGQFHFKIGIQEDDDNDLDSSTFDISKKF